MKTLVLAASAAALVAGSATAEVLLVVDTSVANQLTITATTGNSSATISGSDTTGVYLDGFFSGVLSGLGPTGITGDLTSAANLTDGTPNAFRSGTDTGLNLWSWTADPTGDFISGAQAFSGSMTFTISADAYADISGASGGSIYFPADDASDIAGATNIGEWALVPEPGSLALLGLGGLAMLRRRR